MSADTLDDTKDLNALERRLQSWQPTPGSVSRERMLFEAGRTAGRAESSPHFRRGLNALLLAIALSSLAGWGFERTARQQVERELMAARLDHSRQEQAPQRSLPPAGSIQLAHLNPPDPMSYRALMRDLGSSDSSMERMFPAHSRSDQTLGDTTRNTLRVGAPLNIDL
jgi:hypothetical protein